MSGFESSSFKKNVNTPQMREFTVDSGEQDNFYAQAPQVDQSALENEIKNARQQKVTGKVPLTSMARQRIELLAGLGRLTKDIRVENTVFTVRTLKAKEVQDATLFALRNSTNDLEVSFEFRKQQLARALFKIDGQELLFVLGEDTLELRLAFLEALEDTVLNYLLEEFTKLKDEAKNKFDIKTVKEAEEVAEDLKK